MTHGSVTLTFFSEPFDKIDAKQPKRFKNERKI